MPAQQPGAWGIDIGQCGLKAIRLANINGTITATAFDYVEHPKILSQPDADPDLLTREALEKFLSHNSLKGDVVTMSVAGQTGLARFVKLPPVEEKKISDIVKFEAKQQIPFPLEEVVWDFQKIGAGVVTDGFAMETEIGLFAIKRDAVSRALQHFTEVNIEVDVVQMAPLALCNYVAYDLLKKGAEVEGEEGASGKKRDCIVALDIGVDSSNLVITDGGRIIWQRPIPIGGNRFTRALTKDLKLTFAKAEHLKKNATKSPDLKRILMALRADLNEFVNEVQKSLAFFTNSHRDAHIKYLLGLGGAFRLPGLQKYLGEKLQLEVRRLQKFNRLSGDSVITSPLFNDNVLSMAVAYGLALQGLKQSRLQTNLLPQEIRMDRLVRNKKPWAVVAAAALLVGTAALAFGEKLDYLAVADPVIKKSFEEAGDVAAKKAKESDAKFGAKKNEVDHLAKSVRSIVAGQEERLNWLKLTKYINECLPRPDGKNLTEKQKAAYFEGDGGGSVAFQKYGQRQGSNKPDAVGAEDDLDRLIQINLEGVNAVFTDNLADYWKRLKENIQPPKAIDDIPEVDRKNEPKGAGWVVELRGFTYHLKERNFIFDMFVENLATKARGPVTSKTGDIDPLAARVSHVILYDARPDPNPGPTPKLYGSSLLPRLVIPPPTPGVGLGATAVVPRARLRDNWKPQGMEASSFGKRDANAAPPPPPPAPVAGAESTRKRGDVVRTEFIILFIWQEPTPSDELSTVAVPVAPTGPAGPNTKPPGAPVAPPPSAPPK